MKKYIFFVISMIFILSNGSFVVWGEEGVVPAVQAAQSEDLGAGSQAPVAEANKETSSPAAAKETVTPAVSTASAVDESLIRPADTLEIDVYNEPDLSRPVEVDNKGFITYPLIGRVKVEGLTKETAEKTVRDLFEKDYLVNPQVTVRISRAEIPEQPQESEPEAVEPKEEVVLCSYVMLGEIHRSGTYEFNPKKGKMTLLKAVSMAGGFTNIANIGKIKMLRKNGTETKSFIVNAKDIIAGKQPDVEIQEDDLIVVPESLI